MSVSSTKGHEFVRREASLEEATGPEDVRLGVEGLILVDLEGGGGEYATRWNAESSKGHGFAYRAKEFPNDRMQSKAFAGGRFECGDSFRFLWNRR